MAEWQQHTVLQGDPVLINVHSAPVSARWPFASQIDPTIPPSHHPTCPLCRCFFWLREINAEGELTCTLQCHPESSDISPGSNMTPPTWSISDLQMESFNACVLFLRLLQNQRLFTLKQSLRVTASKYLLLSINVKSKCDSYSGLAVYLSLQLS